MKVIFKISMKVPFINSGRDREQLAANGLSLPIGGALIIYLDVVYVLRINLWPLGGRL